MAVDRNFLPYNLAYLLDLYERFEADPESVSPEYRTFFQTWSPPTQPSEPSVTLPDDISSDQVIASAYLAQAIRTYGHLAAHLDPLGSAPPGDPALNLETYHLTEDILLALPASVVGGPVADGAGNAFEAIRDLKKIYMGTIGYEYGHIHSAQEREWLRHTAECGALRPPQAPVDETQLLKRLTQVEAFELFLHRFFPGKTRFSIEGLDMMVPMLDEMINESAEEEVCMAMLGMAHRGRLNVLAHVLSKPYAQILAEFKDPGQNYTTLDELGWTGDVTYHKGARRAIRGGEQVKMVVWMAPNPSHLEHVNPVVAGMARAASSGVNQPGAPIFYPKATLPVLIHGDAAFPGEGVVAETLNLSQLPGYHVGGSVHLIANNQLGFTTLPHEGRSTLYASDLAKGFDIPVIHVNADDPLACLEAARSAIAYRMKFQKDFVIDLVGYRRYGHNEGDEPGFTQPEMYQKIDKHPSVRTILIDRLLQGGIINPELPAEWMENQMRKLQQILDTLNPEAELFNPPRLNGLTNDHYAVQTAVSRSQLQQMNEDLYKFPDGFTLNRKLEKPIQRRRSALDNPDQPTIEWAHAEELAFATILADGIPIRLTGQDTERGTFSQRHAVFHDPTNGQTFTPLQALPKVRASFEVCNSPLSENAVLGFEFGYNVAFPKRLVVWEAQYGDFINSAQAIIDEFVVSGWSKWNQKPSLVLLLPHGYEGQGPDHSSGRLERFLQLSTEANIRITNSTTAAQYFHLLRMQAGLLEKYPLPLVIFTPKSLLRHPRVASSLQELTDGAWKPVLDDPRNPDPARVTRLLLCSGKIAVDLFEARQADIGMDAAIVRLEQLSPFPRDELEELLQHYAQLEEIVWVQEEPENMGAWSYVRPRIREMLRSGLQLHYTGRAPSASPSEGSMTWHTVNQKQILAEALGLGEHLPQKNYSVRENE